MILRLVRNGRARYDTARLVHEALIPEGKVASIHKGRLLHTPRQTVEAEAMKQNNYTTLKVAERLANGRRARPGRMLVSPPLYILRSYLMKRYFLCGWAGFAHSVTSGQYAFQTEYKHWRASLMK
jgi:hypothetical protein